MEEKITQEPIQAEKSASGTYPGHVRFKASKHLSDLRYDTSENITFEVRGRAIFTIYLGKR